MKKRYNILIILLFLILLSFVFYIPARKKATGAMFGMSNKISSNMMTAGIKTKKFFSFFFHIADLKNQNDDLSQKIVAYQVDRSRIEELEHENELLKKELGFAEKNKETKLLPSRIIGREPTTFLDYIIIDKGDIDGVKNNMAVVSGGVLIGQISEVYKNQSKVILVTSKDSIIMAMLQNSRSTGLLRGGISGLVLENITQDITYDTGEYVVTSGLDGQLPPGLLIGKTGKIQSSSSDLFKNISVEPVADLSKLELVFIME